MDKKSKRNIIIPIGIGVCAIGLLVVATISFVSLPEPNSVNVDDNNIVNDYPETVSNEYVRGQVDNWWYYGMGQSEIRYDGILYQLEGTNSNYFTRNDNSHLYENGGTSWTWRGLETYELIYDYDAKNLWIR